MYQEAIATWLDGYNFYPRRSENIYEIVKHYRYTSQHQLSYHFYKLGKYIHFPADNTLFLHKFYTNLHQFYTSFTQALHQFTQILHQYYTNFTPIPHQ